MELNLIDKLLLLALDDEKGTFASEPFALTYGLAGAILLELSFKESIIIIDKKVKVNKRTHIGNKVLDTYFRMIVESKKERSLTYWIQTFGNKERAIKKESLDKLIVAGILAKREEKFLWVFNNDKYPTTNPKPENALRKRLYSIIENNRKPETDEFMLISLIDTCKLNRVVYGKQRAKNCKQRIKEVMKNAKNSSDISATVNEVQTVILAMIMAVISATMVATTMSSN